MSFGNFSKLKWPFGLSEYPKLLGNLGKSIDLLRSLSGFLEILDGGWSFLNF